MTPSEWLARRTPPPPPMLRTRLEEALSADTAESKSVTDACLHAAERLIEVHLQGECTSRHSALDLLTADALVTYAFEAVAESPAALVPRAAAAMRRIASLGVARQAGAAAE